MSGWQGISHGDGVEYDLRPDAERLYGTADAKIIKWRCECFEELGFAMGDALTLALRRDVDRVVVEKAIKAGNSHKHVMEALL